MNIEFNPLVTCIIPVYNAEKYLKQGIDSLLNQSYKNIEILLVDDNSTDGSWAICNKYSKEFKNVIAVKTEANSGSPLEGRRMGIEKATGDWITFMDSDDYVLVDYIKHLVEGTEGGKYDISVTGHSRLYEDGSIEHFVWKSNCQSTKERLNNFYDHFIKANYHTDPVDTVGQNLIRSQLAKKTILNNLPSNIYAEDTVMALNFLANSSNGVNYVDHHDFIWRQIPGSGSHGGFYRRADRNAFFDACNLVFSRKDIAPLLDTSIGKISIIVPIYNVEQYIHTCLDSILDQTYKNIELILVDDKSLDRSGNIADDYAQKDDRVKVIHKSKNEGLNMARATGFDNNTGTYVMFVDSDDLITHDCIDNALRAIIKHKVEFAKFKAITFSDEDNLSDSVKTTADQSEEIVVTGKKDLYKSRFYDNKVGPAKVTVWGGLYLSEAVKKIDWKKTNYRQHEDIYWTLHFYEFVNKGVFMSKVGYLYRINDSNASALSKSLTGNQFNGKPIGALEFTEKYIDILKHYDQKYELGLSDEIKEFQSWQATNILSKIARARLLNAESNIEYLPDVIENVIISYQDAKLEISKQNEKINAIKIKNNNMMNSITELKSEANVLREEKRTLNTKLDEENRNRRILENDLRSHLTIKRSARLLVGNVKRKLKSVIK